MDATADNETAKQRRKRTIWLMAGGAASLLIPLLGVFFLREIDTPARSDSSSGRSELFERRDADQIKIVPGAAPTHSIPLPTPSRAPKSAAPTAAPAPSSLDLIQSASELKPKPEAAAPAPDAKPTTPNDPQVPAAKSATGKKKSGKKTFNQPKLQGGKSFKSFAGGSVGKKNAAPQTGGDANQLLNNLPPGAADNPQVQQYLKSQGR